MCLPQLLRVFTSPCSQITRTHSREYTSTNPVVLSGNHSGKDLPPRDGANVCVDLRTQFAAHPHITDL